MKGFVSMFKMNAGPSAELKLPGQGVHPLGRDQGRQGLPLGPGLWRGHGAHHPG